MDSHQSKIVREFLEKETYCVMSTVNSENKPESAVMSFSITEDNKIVLSTNKNSRKAKNILQNPNVAISFGVNPVEYTTIQVEGEVQIAKDEELEKFQNVHVAKNPFSKKFVFDDDNIMLVVSPKWIRYSKLSEPVEVFEVSMKH